MRLYELVHRALSRKFTVLFTSEQGKISISHVIENRSFSELGEISNQARSIADTINLSGLHTIFTSEIGMSKDISKISIELETKLPEDLSKEIVFEVLDYLIYSDKYVLEFLMIYQKFNSVLNKKMKNKTEEEDLSEALFLSLAYYCKQRDWIKLANIKPKAFYSSPIKNQETLINTLSLLPFKTCSAQIRMIAESSLPSANTWNFKKFMVLPLETFNFFLNCVAQHEEYVDILTKFFINQAFWKNATSGQMKVIYNLFIQRLFRETLKEWYEFFIPMMWYFHHANINRAEILKTIQALAPHIKENIEKTAYWRKNTHGFLVMLELNVKLNLLDNKPIDISSVCYEAFFSNEKPRKKIHEVLCQIYTILEDPELVVTLLSHFERELKQTWMKKFPDKDILSIRQKNKKVSMEYMPWPIPTSRPSFKTHRLLSEQIIHFMRERNFAGNLYRATGLIEAQEFFKIIENGDMFIESSLSPYFFIHGKTIHNIGRIVVIIAWEQGFLAHKDDVSLRDIFKAMSNSNDLSFVPRTYWTQVFDSAATKENSFTDPHMFHSFLMTHCEESLPYLSTLLTHSFSKDIYKLLDYVNLHHDLNLTVDQLVEFYIAPRVLYTVADLISYDTNAIEEYLKNQQKLGDPVSTGKTHLYYYNKKLSDVDMANTVSDKNKLSNFTAHN
jgi:hypothetical protein